MGRRGGRPPTFPHAGQGQGELAHEVVAGGAVVVLHHEAHQGQLGRPQLEPQRLLPARVEACGSGTGGGRCHRGHRGHPGRWDQLGPPPHAPLPQLSRRPALGNVGTGADWGNGRDAGTGWAVLGKWGSYWGWAGLYRGNGAYSGAGLGYTGKWGVILRLWCSILGEWGSCWSWTGLYWGMGVILVLGWALLGEWESYWGHSGVYWGSGVHTGAGLGYTGGMGAILGPDWIILGERRSHWG